MKELIEKYFNGRTSNAEEKEIFNYFASGNIAPEFKEDEEYFRYMASFKLYAKEIIPKENYMGLRVKPAMTKGIVIALAVAASFALLILLFPFWNTNNGFIVKNGKEYTKEKKMEVALLASLEDVKLETKQLLDDSNNDLLNLKNIML